MGGSADCACTVQPACTVDAATTKRPSSLLSRNRPPQAVPYLVDLVADPSPVIRVVASAGLDVVIDADAGQDAWAPRLRLLKFEAHNQAWLSMVNGQQQVQQGELYGMAADEAEDLARTLARPAAALGRHSADDQVASPGGGMEGAAAGGMPGADGGVAGGAAVDYGLYEAGGQVLALDIESYQQQAEAQHQRQLEEQHRQQLQADYWGGDELQQPEYYGGWGEFGGVEVDPGSDAGGFVSGAHDGLVT
jgi:hypothetical protein